MLKLRLRSSILGLLVALAWLGVSACSNQSLVAGDGGHKTAGPDGSVTGIGASDPAACGCQVAGDTLTISVDCYCKQYDCTQSPETLFCSEVTYGIGCGIMQVSLDTVGGLEKWVYNDERTLIGAQLATDAGAFTCPTDPSLRGNVLRAGAFPLDDGGMLPLYSCGSVTSCPCVDGKVSCPAFDASAAFDAGTSTVADAATP
jgi:hypothetical protein